MMCFQRCVGRPNGGVALFNRSPFHLKQIPSDLFLKWIGLSLPKRTREGTKRNTHTHTDSEKHVTTRWKRGRRDRGSDWFSCHYKADPSGGLDNVRERKKEEDGEGVRKLRNGEKKRIKKIIKNKILCPTPVPSKPSFLLFSHSSDLSSFSFSILPLLNYTGLSLFWVEP